MKLTKEKYLQRALKIGIFFSFVLLIVGLLSARSTPCTGWESNIYINTPLIFWLAIIIAYLLGIGIVIYSRFYHPLPKQIRILGWTLIVFSAISILFLAIIRGYKVLNIDGDTGTHLGLLSQLLESGQITGTYYPGIYWEPASLCLLTGLNPKVVLNIFPVILTCIFLLGLVILAKTIFPKKGEISLACIVIFLLPFGSAPLFFSGSGGAYYVGMTIGNAVLIPLCLYLVFVVLNGFSKMLIPLLILNFSVIFYHPNISISFGIIYIAAIVLSLVPFLRMKKIARTSQIHITISLLSLITLFILWLWSFFGKTIVFGIISIFNVNADDKGIEASIELLSSATEFGYGLDTVFKIAGINIFIYCILLFAGIIFIFKFWKNSQYFLVKTLLIISVFFAGIVILSMFGNFIGSPGRFLRVLSIAGILLTGFVLYNMFHSFSDSKKSKKFIHICILFTVIVGIGLISIPSYYSSPNTLGLSSQTTQATYTGAETLLPRIDYSNTESTGIFLTSLERYVNAIYGSPYTVGTYISGDFHIISASRSATDAAPTIIYHFGYDKGNTSLTNVYTNKTYVFITDKDKRYYQEYNPKLAQSRWTTQDFKQLSVDQGVKKIYDNKGMVMYIVN